MREPGRREPGWNFRPFEAAYTFPPSLLTTVSAELAAELAADNWRQEEAVAMMVETMVAAMLKDRQGSGWMAKAKLAETSWRQEAEAEEGPTSG